MKKTVMTLIAITLMFALAACGGDAGKPSDDVASDSPVQTVEPDRESSQPITAETEAESPDDTETIENGTKALVVFFSATGNTRAVAETIAGLQGADIYEIVPQQPYTDEDLNYSDSSSRATTEQNAPEALPAISGGVENIAEYDVIYVGYPNVEQGLESVLCA